MPDALRTLLHPMHIAGIVTWLAVALALRVEDSTRKPLLWALLVAYLVALLAGDFIPRRHLRLARAWLLATEAICALALVWLAPRGGVAPVLLVVLVAQLAMAYPPRVVVPAVIALNVLSYLLLRDAGQRDALIVSLLYAGFQAFAALSSHYARSAEASRDALMRVNADLLATRALFAESARDAERLRMARELHDVAGHKLTALTLNLRMLAADPTHAPRAETATAQALAAELMHDLRDVVQSLRDTRGLDLRTALHALAAPLPTLKLALTMDDDVEVTDAGTAEVVLRLVQEALTNSARHAEATTLFVTLARDASRLLIRAEDDGRVRGPIREGSGLAGMRERVAAANGTLDIAVGDHGALRIDASVPL
jgi:signal transduction histidine kinase